MYNREFVKGCVELFKEFHPEDVNEEDRFREMMNFYGASLSGQEPITYYDMDNHPVIEMFVSLDGPDKSYFRLYINGKKKTFTLKDGIKVEDV